MPPMDSPPTSAADRLRPDLKDSIQHFEQEAGAIFNAAAVFIRPAVGGFMQKLLNEVHKAGLKLDAIEASVFSNPRGVAIGGAHEIIGYMPRIMCSPTGERGHHDSVG